MLIYILLALVAIVAIGLAINVGYWDGVGEGVITGAGVLLVGSVLSMFIWFVAYLFAPGGEKVAQTTSLSALGNDSNISGSFFLGSGTIDEEQVYQFIAQTDDGGYYLDSVPVDNVIVYTDSTPDTATYVQYVRVVDNFWLSSEPIEVHDTYKDEFHIPEGSIDFSYRISVTD